MTSRLLVLVLAGWAAACAPASLAPLPADHPASASAPAAFAVSMAAALPPAPRPDLPAALRAAPAPAVQAEAMPAPAAPSGAPGAGTLAPTLDAYFAVQRALAADDLPAAVTAARVLGDALARLTASPPPGHPHFWHARAEEVDAVTGHATALAEAENLVAARVAFGYVSPAVAAWVDALGVPEGYDLARFTCGMFREAPEGGVWMQQGAAVRNPYFGAAMLGCGTRDRVESRNPPASTPHHR